MFRTYLSIKAGFGLLATITASSAFSHGAHVHGQAELYLAFNNERELAIEFKAPNADIFGFETLGSGQERQAQLKKQQAVLQNLEGLVKLSGQSSCNYQAKSLKAFDRDLLKVSGDEKARKAKHDHKKSEHSEKPHHHKHGKGHAKHDHAHHHGDHSDFEGSYVISCQEKIAGQKLELRIGEAFPSIQRLSVVLLGDTDQKKWDVRQARYEISL